MNKLVLVITLKFLCFSQVACGDQFESRKAVIESYSDQIVSMSDLDEEVSNDLIVHEALKTPGLVESDINKDGDLDVVILTKNNSPVLLLRFYLCKPKECVKIEQLDLGEFYGLQYISSVDEGEGGVVRYSVYGKTNIIYGWDSHKKAVVLLTEGD